MPFDLRQRIDKIETRLACMPGFTIQYNTILSRVRDKITKKDTQMRAAITAEERLLITLRYDLIIAYHTKMMTSHLKCPFISSSQTS